MFSDQYELVRIAWDIGEDGNQMVSRANAVICGVAQ